MQLAGTIRSRRLYDEEAQSRLPITESFLLVLARALPHAGEAGRRGAGGTPACAGCTHPYVVELDGSLGSFPLTRALPNERISQQAGVSACANLIGGG